MTKRNRTETGRSDPGAQRPANAAEPSNHDALIADVEKRLATAQAVFGVVNLALIEIADPHTVDDDTDPKEQLNHTALTLDACSKCMQLGLTTFKEAQEALEQALDRRWSQQ